jgi:hypothetical protein
LKYWKAAHFYNTGFRFSFLLQDDEGFGWHEFYFSFTPNQPMKFEGLIENVKQEGLGRKLIPADSKGRFIFCIP